MEKLITFFFNNMHQKTFKLKLGTSLRYVNNLIYSFEFTNIRKF